jgi:hypothetical protein
MGDKITIEINKAAAGIRINHLHEAKGNGPDKSYCYYP